MDSFRATIRHPKLLQLYDYWCAIRGDREMPARRDLDPIDIPALMANIALLDVEYDPLRFRYRLYGTTICAIGGRDQTGRYLDEPETSRIADIVCPANRTLVETRRPHAMDAHYPLNSGRLGHFHRLALPFSEDGARVTMIMVGFFREYRESESAALKETIATA